MTDDDLERLRREGDQPEPLFPTDRSCANPACGLLLERRPRESNHNFRRRRTCGDQACKLVVAALSVGPERSCPVCEATLVRKAGESNSNFQRRKSCGSPDCVKVLAVESGVRSATARAESAPADAPRVCGACRRPLLRRSGEQGYQFRRRQTCGKDCALELRRQAQEKASAARKAAAAAKRTTPSSRPIKPTVSAVRSKLIPVSTGLDARQIRQEWQAHQWGMSRDAFARMLRVPRERVDEALGVAS